MGIQECVDRIDQYFTSANGVPMERAAIPAELWQALKATLVTGPVSSPALNSAEFEQFVLDYNATPTAATGFFAFADAFIHRFKPPAMVQVILSARGRTTAEGIIRWLYNIPCPSSAEPAPTMPREIIDHMATAAQVPYRDYANVWSPPEKDDHPTPVPGCNQGNQCPWSSGDPSHCTRCGLKAQGSCQ
jgi:hypothetical protein